VIDKLYKEMLRDQIGPLLRASGFKGPAGHWSLTDTATGDLALVQTQGSAWNTAAATSFYVNLAVVPAPWWQYLTYRDGGTPSKTPKEYHGVWRARLDGRGRGSWTITDAASARQAGQHVTTLLTDEGVPQLRHFLHRAALLDHLRTKERHTVFTGEPLAVVLADAGPSAELDEVLDQIRADVAGDDVPLTRTRRAHRLIEWTSAHAASRGQ
jgi:hypothetical protein